MQYATPAMMDLARQLHESNLDWPYGTGDHFCAEGEDMQICVDIKQKADGIWICTHDNEYPLNSVNWMPKRTQALQWLMERGWKLSIQTDERRTLIEALNQNGNQTPIVEGFGHTELEALYDTMLHVLDSEI